MFAGFGPGVGRKSVISMPTDTPAYERATTAVRATIGPERFATLTEDGARFDADGWLAESGAVVDAARNHQPR